MAEQAKKETVGFGIVERIRVILKMDEAGKIEKFFKYKVAIHERSIVKLNINLDALKNTHKFAKEELADKLEDAVDNLKSVEEQVSLDDIRNNADMKAFSDVYDDSVSEAETIIKNVEFDIKEDAESYGEEVTRIKKEIKLHTERINRIKQ